MLLASAEREQQLQRELQSKQESLQRIEMTISSAREREDQLRKQYDSVKAECESLKPIAASVEEAKQELERRTTLINQKAMELLEKENALRVREQSASGGP